MVYAEEGATTSCTHGVGVECEVPPLYSLAAFSCPNFSAVRSVLA